MATEMMTHNVTERPDGRLEFAGRQPSWRALGTEVAGLDVMEAAKEAGLLGWNLRTEPVRHLTTGGRIVEVPGRVVLRDTSETDPERGAARALGVVGERYTQVPQERWVPWVQDVVSVADGQVYVDAMGSVDGGRLAFAVLGIEGSGGWTTSIGGFDKLASFLVITTSHDGSTPLSLTPHMLRLFCTNQVRGLAGKLSQSVYRVRHTASAGDLNARIAEARRALQIGSDFTNDVAVAAEGLLAQAVSDKQFENIIRVSYPDLDILYPTAAEVAATEEPPARQITRAEHRREALFGLWRGDTVAGSGIGGTAWGALQAVGEYADWVGSVRGGDDARARRSFVAAATIEAPKARAHEAVLALR